MPDLLAGTLLGIPGAEAAGRPSALRRILGFVGLPLAVGGGLLAAGALAEKAKAVPRATALAELEKRIGEPLSEEQRELASSGYDVLKTYAPSTLRHPVVAANYMRRFVMAREIDPSIVQQLVDIERSFRQPEAPGAGAVGLISGLGRVLGELIL